MTSYPRSAPTLTEPHAPDRRHPLRTALVVVVVLIGLPLQLLVGCGAAVDIMNDRATQELTQRAEELVAGTPWSDVPVDQLPGYGTSGSVLCMDNCLYLSFDVPAGYATAVEDNVTLAGWAVDPPGCLTSPERIGPPCVLLDQDGTQIGLASYWPGPNLSIMLGPG